MGVGALYATGTSCKIDELYLFMFPTEVTTVKRKQSESLVDHVPVAPPDFSKTYKFEKSIVCEHRSYATYYDHRTR